MNKNNNSNNYANAVNVANKFLDSMFDALNLPNAEQYHITEDDLHTAVDSVKEKATAAKDNVKKISNNIAVDFSDLVTTLNTVFDEYKQKYMNQDDHSEDCDCDCDCAVDECDGCCNAFTPYADDLDKYSDFTPEYCKSIRERLMDEFNIEREIAECDEIEYYPYEDVLEDINYILDDVENAEYELIPANDTCKHDTVHVTYHLGYDNLDEYDIAVSYAQKLADDLRELYGFSEVHVSFEDNSEYITYNIYMLI